MVQQAGYADLEAHEAHKDIHTAMIAKFILDYENKRDYETLEGVS